jgi:hypothetical protein
MSLSDLASVGTLVGSLAVVVSIIYLALQTRQTARNQRATIQWARLLERNERARYLNQNDLSAWIQGQAGDQTLDDAQCLRYFNFAGSEMREFEEVFFQYQDGMIDKRRHAVSLHILRARFARPGFRALWRMARRTYDQDFVRFCDDIAKSVPVTADGNSAFVGTWKTLAAEELAKESSSASRVGQHQADRLRS